MHCGFCPGCCCCCSWRSGSCRRHQNAIDFSLYCNFEVLSVCGCVGVCLCVRHHGCWLQQPPLLLLLLLYIAALRPRVRVCISADEALLPIWQHDHSCQRQFEASSTSWSGVCCSDCFVFKFGSNSTQTLPVTWMRCLLAVDHNTLA